MQSYYILLNKSSELQTHAIKKLQDYNLMQAGVQWAYPILLSSSTKIRFGI